MSDLSPAGSSRTALACYGIPVRLLLSLIVRYIQLSLTVLLSGAIRQVLVHPSSQTARIDPTHPVIQAIPTFGTEERCFHIGAGYKPVNHPKPI